MRLCLFVLESSNTSMYACMYLVNHQFVRPVLTSTEPILPSFPGSYRAVMATVAALGPTKFPLITPPSPKAILYFDAACPHDVDETGWTSGGFLELVLLHKRLHGLQVGYQEGGILNLMFCDHCFVMHLLIVEFLMT
jgi:hypothetical protein